MRASRLAFGIVLFGVGCAAISPNKDASTDASKDVVATDTSGPYPCGALTCGSGEYCIHPCCARQCVSPANGMCPFGSSDDASCTTGCRATSCTPPPLRCSTNDPCIGISLTNRDAFCVCG